MDGMAAAGQHTRPNQLGRTPARPAATVKEVTA
jgi:hypothetical protein